MRCAACQVQFIIYTWTGAALSCAIGQTGVRLFLASQSYLFRVTSAGVSCFVILCGQTDPIRSNMLSQDFQGIVQQSYEHFGTDMKSKLQNMPFLDFGPGSLAAVAGMMNWPSNCDATADR